MEKKKRKRRTKAQMDAARKKEAQSTLGEKVTAAVAAVAPQLVAAAKSVDVLVDKCNGQVVFDNKNYGVVAIDSSPEKSKAVLISAADMILNQRPHVLLDQEQRTLDHLMKDNS